MDKLFGTDGVRGVANTSLSPELAYRLGRTAAGFFGQKNNKAVFIIGRDTRISGQMLEAALIAGICSTGGKALSVGIVPTPTVAYLTRSLCAQAGIVISASHNPYFDNGIKFFCNNGYKLSDKVEDDLEKLMIAKSDNMPRPVNSEIGTIEYRYKLVNQYIEYIINTVDINFEKIKIVLDCANGSSYKILPKILKKLGAVVIVINGNPNGININKYCGSTCMEGLQKAVIKYKADIGIANDGDADRCLAVDETGAIIDGDQIMAICALEMIRKKQLKDNTLVVTVMSNIGLHKAINKAGGKVVVTQVGDRNVLKKMLEMNYSFGGEQSGHIIFGQHSTTGDGILTAVQLISSFVRSGKKFSKLASLMTCFPQIFSNVRVRKIEKWYENENIKRAIEIAKEKLEGKGRIFIRSSGTEPLIRIMAEGPNSNELKNIVKNITNIITFELQNID